MSQQNDAARSPVTAGDPRRDARRQQPGRRKAFHQPFCSALTAFLAVALTACGGESRPQHSATPPPSVSAPHQDARGTAEELALDAYRGMWGAYAKAGLAANPDEPDLAKYASGTALATLREGLTGARRDGHVIKGELGSNPQVTEASPSTQPTTVSVTDCLNTEKFLTYTRSGDPVDNEPGGRRLTKATVTNLGTGEGWKVTGLGIQAVGTCG